METKRSPSMRMQQTPFSFAGGGGWGWGSAFLCTPMQRTRDAIAESLRDLNVPRSVPTVTDSLAIILFQQTIKAR